MLDIFKVNIKEDSNLCFQKIWDNLHTLEINGIL